MSLRTRRGLALLATFAFVAAACTSGASPTPEPTATAPGATAPPAATSATKTPMLRAIITTVTIPSGARSPAVLTRWTVLFAPVGWPEHSGQRIPTGPKTMQSVQIARPQLEQLTPVSTRGWR